MTLRFIDVVADRLIVSWRNAEKEKLDYSRLRATLHDSGCRSPNGWTLIRMWSMVIE